jgi:hypothetical protein
VIRYLFVARLSIHLQDGFEDDLVVITVGGEQVYRGEHVTTKLLLGYAEVIETQLTSGSSAVRIALPARSLSRDIGLPTSGDAHLVVSIEGGEIACHIADRPVGYL